MGGAENDIHGIGARLEYRWHRIDHRLDAFIGRKQAECQDDGMAGEAELGFRLVRVEKGDIRNAVRNDLDLFRQARHKRT